MIVQQSLSLLHDFYSCKMKYIKKANYMYNLVNDVGIGLSW